LKTLGSTKTEIKSETVVATMRASDEVVTWIISTIIKMAWEAPRLHGCQQPKCHPKFEIRPAGFEPATLGLGNRNNADESICSTSTSGNSPERLARALHSAAENDADLVNSDN
jgi:hypothetical protein